MATLLDDKKLTTTTQPASTAAPATPSTPSTPSVGDTGSNAAPNTGYNNNITGAAYNTARTDAINQMYAAQQTARENELKAAYDQQMSAAQAAADRIPGQYQQQVNDLAVQYERNRRNLNMQAAANGINTGAGSQQTLALQGAYQRDYGTLGRAQADAEAEAQRNMANLTASYQSNVAAALAQNDYQKAAALLDEYNNAQQRDLKNAQILAEFGDFSGYASLYGQEQADNMANVWKFQNPDLAWNLGKITGEEYYKATGSYPIDYTPAGSSGGGSSGGSWYTDRVNAANAAGVSLGMPGYDAEALNKIFS